MSTWLIIGTPSGIRCWDLGEPDDDERATLVEAARVLMDFPAHDEWVLTQTPFDVQLTEGEPHPTLLERATVGTVDELRTADPAAVEEHAAARRAAARERDVEAMKTALAAMSPEVLAAVLAHPDVATRIATAHKGG